MKKIKGYAIVGDDGFLMFQKMPTMECQVYIDSSGLIREREILEIKPCTITYQPSK